MKKELLDTNVLLRFLTGDNAKQQQEAGRWFKEAEQRKRKIIVIPLVVAETCFVLESFYKMQREKIAEALEVFLAQKWFEVPERQTLLGLWSRYRQGLHFVGSFLLSFAKAQNAGILTFDKNIRRVKL